MSGLVDRITGRVKKAAGDLKDDPKLREQGAREEQKADAKEALARAQREADERAEEVARLEREGRLRGPLPGTFTASLDGELESVARPLVERPPHVTLRAVA